MPDKMWMLGTPPWTTEVAEDSPMDNMDGVDCIDWGARSDSSVHVVHLVHVVHGDCRHPWRLCPIYPAGDR